MLQEAVSHLQQGLSVAVNLDLEWEYEVVAVEA